MGSTCVGMHVDASSGHCQVHDVEQENVFKKKKEAEEGKGEGERRREE